MTLDGERKRHKIKEKTQIKKGKNKRKKETEEKKRQILIFSRGQEKTVIGKRNGRLKREKGHSTQKIE